MLDIIGILYLPYKPTLVRWSSNRKRNRLESELTDHRPSTELFRQIYPGVTQIWAPSNRAHATAQVHLGHLSSRCSSVEFELKFQNAEKLSSISATRSRRSGKVWKTEIVSPKCRNGQLGGKRGEGGGKVKGEEEGNLNGERERFWQTFPRRGGGNIRKEKDPIVLKAAPESGSNLLPVQLWMMIGVGMICKSSEKKEKKIKELEKKKRRARAWKCGGEYLPMHLWLILRQQ